jgi:hypothetical protein
MTPPPAFDNRDSNSDEYEEISSAEVDRVIQALETLMQSVSSENIRAYLDEAADNVYSLIYDAEGHPCDGSDSADDEYQGEAA